VRLRPWHAGDLERLHARAREHPFLLAPVFPVRVPDAPELARVVRGLAVAGFVVEHGIRESCVFAYDVNSRHRTAWLLGAALDCAGAPRALDDERLVAARLLDVMNLRKVYSRVPDVLGAQVCPAAVEGVLRDHRWYDGAYHDELIVVAAARDGDPAPTTRVLDGWSAGPS
jgi:hypothetical protein